MPASKPRMGKLLLGLLLLYGLASLIHFTHNAEFLRDYPNMPSGLSRAQVYAAWLAVTAAGICGYALWRRGHEILGLCVIAAYAALGFDGLAHYALAPFAAHSVPMHLTILLEVVAAAGLFAAALGRMVKLALPR
jgi:hypothetical protein